MAHIPILKFGGLTLQGKFRFGPDEDRLLEECRRADSVNEIYRLLAWRRNSARAQRLREVCRDFILPLKQEGLTPVVVVSAFDWATDKLEQLSACIDDAPDPRQYARLLMSGELRANAALAMALEAVGCPAYSLTGREAGIETTPQPVDALVEGVDEQYLVEIIKRGIVPVVAGFQGHYYDAATERDEVSILGRGGSNLTAVALADALGQPECTMFSNVDGVYDKDPSMHADARKYDEVQAADLLTWDPFPQVIQREAVMYARERGIDIWIRDSFDPLIPGTKIVCRG